MIQASIVDRMGEQMLIEERTCPKCEFPGALAMVCTRSPNDQEQYFVAWCPCGTVFEFNDDGKRILVNSQKDADKEWWRKT